MIIDPQSGQGRECNVDLAGQVGYVERKAWKYWLGTEKDKRPSQSIYGNFRECAVGSLPFMCRALLPVSFLVFFPEKDWCKGLTEEEGSSQLDAPVQDNNGPESPAPQAILSCKSPQSGPPVGLSSVVKVYFGKVRYR